MMNCIFEKAQKKAWLCHNSLVAVSACISCVLCELGLTSDELDEFNRLIGEKTDSKESFVPTWTTQTVLFIQRQIGWLQHSNHY